MKLTDADIKQIYFYCKNNNPNGIYHNNDDELDIVEFANKIADYVTERVVHEAKREEHTRCVDLVEKVNPTIARYLLDHKQYVE
jgi:hypothetical protein